MIDKHHGIEVQTNVHRTVWDCLLERLIEIELGNVREGVASIYNWQLSTIDGGKLETGTVPGEALEDGTVPINKLDPDLVEALRKAWEDIETAQGMIDSANEWLDTLDYSVEILQAAVGDNAGNIAALQITSEMIRAAVRDAESNIAVLEITANQIATALRDAEGNISTLQQSAKETSSTISSMNGEISSIRQTANNISSTVSTLDGKVASLVQQVAEGIAIKLRNTSVNANYELGIRSAPEYSNWANTSKTCYGIEMQYNGRYFGGLFVDGSDSGMSSWYQALVSPGRQRLLSSNGVNIMSHDLIHSGASMMYIFFDPDQSVGKRLQCSEAWTVASDRRLKREIAEIDQGEALFDALLARQYRMADGGPLHYGFIAQDVKAVLERLGIPETVMLSDALSDDKFMGLTYQEFIALTVHKVQRIPVTALDMDKAAAGTLPIARGGTGATAAADARANLDVPSKTEMSDALTEMQKKITGGSVTLTGGAAWTLTGSVYEQAVNVPGLPADSGGSNPNTITSIGWPFEYMADAGKYGVGLYDQPAGQLVFRAAKQPPNALVCTWSFEEVAAL